MLQLQYFKKDIKRMLGKHKIRIIHIWMSRSFWGVFLYRYERSLFLLLGNTYSYLRIPFIPCYNLIQAYSNIDIHYKADIKGGISILHSSVGCVISGQSIIGENLTLTGGNIIGVKRKCNPREFVLGDNCTLGANATIIGPLILANNVNIAAAACVIHTFLKNKTVLGGVPAKIIK